MSMGGVKLEDFHSSAFILAFLDLLSPGRLKSRTQSNSRVVIFVCLDDRGGPVICSTNLTKSSAYDVDGDQFVKSPSLYN